MNKDNENEVKRKEIIKKRRRGKNVSRRLGVLFFMVLLAFVGLGMRLIYITTTNNNEYQRKILSQQAYDSKTLTAKRGEILDANGTVLATSVERYNVILDAFALNTADEEKAGLNCRNKTLNALKAAFNVDTSIVSQYITDVPNSRYYIVKKGVSYEEMSRFLAYTTKPQDENIENSMYDEGVTGVWFEKYYIRDYPQKTVASDVIGFSLSEGMASYGLEEYYNDVLMGVNGRQYGYLSDDTTLEYTTIPAVDGDTLVTTIDTNIQKIVEKYLKEFSYEYKDNARPGFGSENIGCIVMKADTGEILAMANYPEYDLNNPYDLSEIYTSEELQALNQDKAAYKDACDALWKNFCISDTYEPGSVMKPFTVAMGLETGKLTGDETYYCGGFLHIGGYDIFCHNRNGDGMLDVKGAVAQSCNVSLMHMAETIGKETFLKYQNVYNIGLKTNIDLSGECRTDSLVFNETTMGDTELATASFGQGFNVTMVQMATGYAALVNGGYYYEPHMVSKILSPSGTIVKNIEPRLVKQIVSHSTSEKIVEYCNAVVTDGTGWRGKPAGYRIGGKTGTAETVPRGNGNYVVSFIAHAPADNPEIICYVVIDRPNVPVQEDAKYPVIVCKKILNEILPYLGIPMTEELTDEDIEALNELELSILTNRDDEDSKSKDDESSESDNVTNQENTEDAESEDSAE